MRRIVDLLGIGVFLGLVFALVAAVVIYST